MTFEEFEKADQRQLKAEAKACFDSAQQMAGRSWDWRVAKLIESQFYMQALDRRHDSWIAWRDLILEFVVILLIGGEIWLGWKVGKDEDRMMTQQNTILGSLGKSTQATADQLRE